MKTLLFTDPSALVQALGLTLVHSLWQGALLLATLLLVWPRLRSARLRYTLAYTTLCSITLLAAVTFVWVYEPAKPMATQAPEPVFTEGILPAVNVASDWSATSFSPEPWYPWLVGLWVAGLVFFLLKLGGGMLYLGRMRRTAQVVTDDTWQLRVDELAQRLALSRPVLLLESALVHTPLTLGFLKPLILMPIGLINQLSASEVEAILAHELAHIARRDWLFNLFQAFMETLFYYHPAVWWLSDRIRAERENCCDDVAVALCGNPLMYAKTLVRLQEMARPTPVLAPALHGTAFALNRKRRPMLTRIKRILNPSQASHNTMEKIVATAILIVLIVLWTIRSGTENLTGALKAMNPVEWVAAQVPGFDSGDGAQTPATDTLPPKTKSTQKIVREDDNERVEMELQNGEVVRLNIDGKDIAASDFDKYEDLVAELMEETAPPPPPAAPPGFNVMPSAPFAPGQPMRISTNKDGNNTVIVLERGGEPMEIVVKEGKVWIDGEVVEVGESIEIPPIEFDWDFEAPPAMVFPEDGGAFLYHFEHPGMPDAPPAPFVLPYGFNYELSDEDMARVRKELKNANKEIERSMEEMRRAMKETRGEQRRVQEELMRSMQENQRAFAQQEREWELMQRNAQRDANRAMAEQQHAYREHERAMEQHRHAESVSRTLKSELVRDGLIDPNNYSFMLSYKKMTINGEKQSDAMHQKYLKLYEGISGKQMKKGDDIQMVEEN